jgi:hypothetical protein
MYDNKIRLSPDVIEKANQIAQQWGLKNARAAVEAVFRKYSDEYMQGRTNMGSFEIGTPTFPAPVRSHLESSQDCEALNELNDLLGL